jgi:chemotaxis family two-component system sensor kinase Cph1
MKSVDLTNCDKEPIHIPGHIQSHGVLIALDNTLHISHVSSNITAYIPVTVAEALGMPLQQLLAAAGITVKSSNIAQLQEYMDEEEAAAPSAFNVTLNNEPYYLIPHKSNAFLLLELEPARAEAELELQRILGASVSRILEGRTLQNTLQNAARQVKEVTGYDRVMVYRFWEDGHGEVIAEERNSNLDPFLGLHYPASDIPQQARELYKVNLTRIIADANSTPAALIARDATVSASPLDLTHSTLRAVSPVHIQYLKNMGVAASFSVSLVIDGHLWGLIACHNYTARFIQYKSREGAKLIGQILSSAVQYRNEEELKEELRIYRNKADDMMRIMQKDWDIPKALTGKDSNILAATAASGAALIFEKNIFTMGNTPTVDQIREICEWLKHTNQSQIFYTDNFSRIHAPAKKYKEVASGLLVCTLSKELEEYILWFKPEISKTVSWAGNPNKPAEFNEAGLLTLSPRKSFEIWKEQVQGVSEKWTNAEFSSVIKLREDIIHIINQKANQIRQLNERLQKAYDELDTFSFTISHDLKTPLSSVKNYAEILLEEYNNLPEDVLKILGRIIRGADKMHLLINEVLAYSRIGRKDVVHEEINMQQMLEDIRTELQTAFRLSNLEFEIGDTPNLTADRTMTYQVFSNLLSNAVKYSSKRPVAKITVSGQVNSEEIIYTIADNGVGIDVAFGNQIFDIFKRLDNAVSFEGTGVGLSIVKRILEKHNAKIWYESKLDYGTVFYLSYSKS